MGYTTDDSMVRVVFFEPNGKWYATEAVKWRVDYYSDTIDVMDAFIISLREHLQGRLSEMDAVCLEPYHKYGHPIMIKSGGWE